MKHPFKKYCYIIMKTLYDIFIIILIVLKISYLLSTMRLKIYKTTHPNDKDKINMIEERNSKLLIITDIGLYTLLLIVFFPSKQEVIVTGHERFLLFALGVIGLLHIDYSAL